MGAQKWTTIWADNKQHPQLVSLLSGPFFGPDNGPTRGHKFRGAQDGAGSLSLVLLGHMNSRSRASHFFIVEAWGPTHRMMVCSCADVCFVSATDIIGGTLRASA
jgi:hypothetical protein